MPRVSLDFNCDRTADYCRYWWRYNATQVLPELAGKLQNFLSSSGMPSVCHITRGCYLKGTRERRKAFHLFSAYLHTYGLIVRVQSAAQTAFYTVKGEETASSSLLICRYILSGLCFQHCYEKEVAKLKLT